MISIVACYHGAKLCAHAARDFQSQQVKLTNAVISQVNTGQVRNQGLGNQATPPPNFQNHVCLLGTATSYNQGLNQLIFSGGQKDCTILGVQIVKILGWLRC